MASAANAQNWGRLATVSATMGVSGSRLCLGEASRGDIGCPAYAPSVTTAGDLGVSGTVTANKFVGDGSGLLNLSASGDRIVSGTLSMLAISNTGYISLTTGGTNWGYLSSLASYIPVLGANTLSSTNISVTLSHYTPRAITSFAGGGGNYIVSSTSSVSASSAGSVKIAAGGTLAMTIVSSGNVGIGTTDPHSTLEIGGEILLNTNGARLRLQRPGGDNYIDFNNTQRFNLRSISANDTSPNNRITIDVNGNVGIGTMAPSYMLHVNGSVAGVGAYNALSDRRFKKNIHPADYGLAAIEKLRPVTFDWISPTSPQLRGRQLGLIAQEVQPLVPEAVSVANDPSHTMSIAYSTLVPVLIKAVQELKADNDNLRAELRTVKDTDGAAVESLQRQLNELMAAKR